MVRGIFLNDLLPRNNEDCNQAQTTHQSDPLMDRRTIEITASENSHYCIEWNPNACKSPSLAKIIINEENTRVCTFAPSDTISRTEPLFLMDKKECRGASCTSEIDMKGVIVSSLSVILHHYWKVQTHLYRPYDGQAYRWYCHIVV